MNMRKTAEWWVNECGGVFCSNCGLFHDDYYDTTLPDKCERCNSIMSEDTVMSVDKEYRLSNRTGNYLDETRYPVWLLELRWKYLNSEQNKQGRCGACKHFMCAEGDDTFDLCKGRCRITNKIHDAYDHCDLQKLIMDDIAPPRYIHCIICDNTVELTNKERIRLDRGHYIEPKVCNECKIAVMYIKNQMENQNEN